MTEALRVTQPTAVKVLRLILENPGLAGIQFSRPKDPDRLSQYMEALDNAINELADRYKIVDTDKGPVGADQDLNCVNHVHSNAHYAYIVIGV